MPYFQKLAGNEVVTVKRKIFKSPIMDYTMYSDRDVCNGISLTSYGHGDPLDLKISVPFKDTAKSYTV